MGKQKIVEMLTAEQALDVMRRLLAKGGLTAEAITDEAMALLSSVEVDDVAKEVTTMLNTIDVQDCWDRASNKADGYMLPEEAAGELLAEILDPYLDQIESYHIGGMHHQEQHYLEAVLRGIHDFEHKADSEFIEWCGELPVEFASGIIKSWRKRHRNDSQGLQEILDYLAENCPHWDAPSITL
jgi:ubiquinone biosynthesis protein UbiJ